MRKCWIQYHQTWQMFLSSHQANSIDTGDIWVDLLITKFKPMVFNTIECAHTLTCIHLGRCSKHFCNNFLNVFNIILYNLLVRQKRTNGIGKCTALTSVGWKTKVVLTKSVLSENFRWHLGEGGKSHCLDQNMLGRGEGKKLEMNSLRTYMCYSKKTPFLFLFKLYCHVLLMQLFWVQKFY